MTQFALLLVDFQKGFSDPIWGGRNNPDAETNGQALLTTARSKNIPVFIIRHDSENVHSPLHPSNPGNELMDWCKPQDGDYEIHKTVNSAFINTTLETQLKGLGVDTLIVAGITSDHCVSTTTRMAANLGFKVLFAKDATVAFDRHNSEGEIIPADTVHTVHLASLDGEFAEVLSTDAILARLG